MDFLLNHHYYLEFYEDQRVDGLDSLAKIFKWFDLKNSYRLHEHQSTFVYEYLSDRQFGADSVMISKSEKGKDKFLYPLFINIFKYKGRTILAISYPYKILQYLTNDMQRIKNVTSIGIDFDTIVDYMSTRKLEEGSYELKNSINVNIVKYTALVYKNLHGSRVKDEKFISKASHVYLKGSNPLDSDVYKHLQETSLFGIEHLAGRLKFIDSKGKGAFNVAFDQKGNFRFYLQKLDYVKTIVLIEDFFHFLSFTNSLIKKTWSSSNILENAEFI